MRKLLGAFACTLLVACGTAAFSLVLVQCGGDAGSPDGGTRTDLTGGTLQWYTTCGDPVCSGHTSHPGVMSCTTEKAGSACAMNGQECDPINDCNSLLSCSSSDPKAHGCPISRRKYKTNIQYLDEKGIS
jgi:hypothetical protein